MSSHVQEARFKRALAITAALVLCVPAIEALADSGSAGQAMPSGAVRASSDAASAGIDASMLIGQGDAFGFLARLEGASTAAQYAMPEAFKREVSLPRHHRDLRVSADGSVVGCIVDAPCEIVARDVAMRMAACGWNEVPLGAVEGATYVKADGACAWSLVTCTQAGVATNVVYRCVYR